MIVARLCPVDETHDIDTGRLIYLVDSPFPGDIIATVAGQRVRVLRRIFTDHGSFEPWPRYVDLELDVRLVGEHDG